MAKLPGLKNQLKGFSRKKTRRRIKPGPRPEYRPGVEALERLVLLADASEVESNDALSVAAALQLTEDPAGGGFLTGRGLGAIGTTADVDYWRFNARAGDRVTVTGEGGIGNNSIYLELRNAGDTILVQQGDTAAGRPEITNYAVTADGTYYVKARTSSSNQTLASYTTRVDVSRGFLAESEPDGATSTASPVALTPGASGHAVGKASGNIKTAGDVDTFHLGILRAGSTVDLSVVRPAVSTLASPRIRLLQGPGGAVRAEATGTGHINLRRPRPMTSTTRRSLSDGGAAVGNQPTYLLQVDVTDPDAPAVLSTTLPATTVTSGGLVFDGVDDHVAIPDSPSLRPAGGRDAGGLVQLLRHRRHPVPDRPDGRHRRLELLRPLARRQRPSRRDRQRERPRQHRLSAGPRRSASGTTSPSRSTTPPTRRPSIIDGDRVNSGTTTRSIGYDSHPVLLGADFSGENIASFHAGSQDEVRIWGVARSQAEIQRDLGRALAGTEPGLAGYWKMDEGTGTTVADATANANHGTLGGIVSARQPTWTTAGAPSLGKALAFDGVNDYVRVPDSPSLRPTGGLTIEGWYNFAAVGGVEAPRRQGDGHRDPTTPTSSGTTAGPCGPGSAMRAPGRWSPSHGRPRSASGTTSPSPSTTPRSPSGCSSTASRSPRTRRPRRSPTTTTRPHRRRLQQREPRPGHFSGKIDEVRIWGVARTPAEIQAGKDSILAGTEPGLAGYWRFEEGSGVRVADATANANHGALGGTAEARQPSWRPGDGPVAGTALKFDGLNDLVEVPNSPSLHSDRALTVEGWFKVGAFDKTWQGLFYKGNTGSESNLGQREYGLWVNSAGYLNLSSTPADRATSGAGQLTIVTPSGIIQAGQWHHFAAVIDANDGSMKLYVDGSLQASGSYGTADIRTTTGPLRLGDSLEANHKFNGTLDEVRLWNVARSQSQIQADKDRVLAGNESGLAGYWRFEEGTGPVAADSTANQNDGRLGAVGLQASRPGRRPGRRGSTRTGCPPSSPPSTASRSRSTRTCSPHPPTRRPATACARPGRTTPSARATTASTRPSRRTPGSAPTSSASPSTRTRSSRAATASRPCRG